MAACLQIIHRLVVTVIERLQGGEAVVLDGANGTEFEAPGAPQTSDAAWADCSATHPEIVRAVHEDYIRAGGGDGTTPAMIEAVAGTLKH